MPGTKHNCIFIYVNIQWFSNQVLLSNNILKKFIRQKSHLFIDANAHFVFIYEEEYET